MSSRKATGKSIIRSCAHPNRKTSDPAMIPSIDIRVVKNSVPSRPANSSKTLPSTRIIPKLLGLRSVEANLMRRSHARYQGNGYDQETVGIVVVAIPVVYQIADDLAVQNRETGDEKKQCDRGCFMVHASAHPAEMPEREATAGCDAP